MVKKVPSCSDLKIVAVLWLPLVLSSPAAAEQTVKELGLRYALSLEVDALRQEIRDALAERDRRFDLAIEAARETAANANDAASAAVAKAERANELRFQSVNEFRAALSDQATRLATRESFDTLSKKVDALAERLDRIQGTGEGADNLWAYITGGILLIIGASGLFLASRQRAG